MAQSSRGITVILSSNLILSISRKDMVVMLQSHDILVFLWEKLGKQVKQEMFNDKHNNTFSPTKQM